MIHPRKINIEPQNDGLEDDFPSRGIFSDSILIFRGVYVIKCVFTKNNFIECRRCYEESCLTPIGIFTDIYH